MLLSDGNELEVGVQREDFETHVQSLLTSVSPNFVIQALPLPPSQVPTPAALKALATAPWSVSAMRHTAIPLIP